MFFFIICNNIISNVFTYLSTDSFTSYINIQFILCTKPNLKNNLTRF